MTINIHVCTLSKTSHLLLVCVRLKLIKIEWKFKKFSKHYEKTNHRRKFYLSACFLMSLLCRDELSLRVRFGKKDLVTEQLDSLILILVSETCICFDVFMNTVIFILLI